MIRRLLIALALGLVALLPTWQFVFGGKVAAPVDWAHASAPWNGVEPASAYDILAMDGALQFLPWRHYMLESFRSGHVPLWNPNTLGGAPFLANSQSAPLYPLHWLWPFDAESLLGFSAWLHLFIAGLGVFALCRRLGATSWGGLVAAISVQLSAFFIAWIALPSVVMTAAWIPWCLWGVLWVAQAQPPPNLPQALGRDLGRPVAAVGVCVGMMLLAGHLQIAAYGLLAIVAFVFWLVAFPCSRSDGSDESDASDKVGKGSRLRALWAIVGLALGAAIAAPQLLPAIENGRQGHRAGVATSEGWEAYKGSAATPMELVTLVSPDFYGTPQPKNERTGATSYWLAYEEPGRHFAEIAFYVGPVVLPLAALALVGIRRRPQVGFFAVLVLLGLAIALGTPIAQALYFGVPGWSATGSPARAAVLMTLGLCVLAGMGLRKDFGEYSIHERCATTVAALFISLILMKCADRPPGVTEVFVNTGGASMYLLGSIVLALVFLPKFCRIPGWVMALAALVHFGLYGEQTGSNRGEYAKDFSGVQELHGAGRIAVIGDDWPFLMAPTKTIAPPSTLLPYGIKTVGGYDSIVSAKYKAKLDDANGRDSAPPANGNMMLVHPGVDLVKLKALGADAVMASTQFTYDLPILFEGEGWRLYDLPGDDPHSFILTESHNERKLAWEGESREKSRAWLESPEADGWEVNLTTYDFRDKTVKAVYRPHSYRLGFLLGMFGGACAIALFLWGGAARRNEQNIVPSTSLGMTEG
ncbi:MAG: hypothetical protein M3R13_02600 [Armatimonadota bacterium]|nr:hypothetical protein [Armatimonadota bacterium]